MKGKRKAPRILRLIQYCAELKCQDEVSDFPAGLHLRGICALFKEKKKNQNYRVVYIGISTSDIRGRLMTHTRDRKKKGWTHFSFYKVWPNVSDTEIREPEALFLHIYRKDKEAQQFNEKESVAVLRAKRIKNLRSQGDYLKKLEKSMRYFPKLVG